MKKYLTAIQLIAIFVIMLPFNGEAQTFLFNSNNATFSVKTDMGTKQIFVTVVKTDKSKIVKKEIFGCGKAMFEYSFCDKDDTLILIRSMEMDIMGVKSPQKNIFVFQCMFSNNRFFEQLKQLNFLPGNTQKEFWVRKFWIAKNRNKI